MIVEKFGIDALKDKAYSSGSSPSSEVFGIAGSFSITSLQPSFPNVLVVSIFGFRMISEKEDSAFKSSWLVYSVVAVISVVTEWGVGFFETTLLAVFFSNSLHRKGATHSPLSHKTIIVAIETE